MWSGSGVVAADRANVNAGTDSRVYRRSSVTPCGLRQAHTLFKRARESERLWIALEQLAYERGIQKRRVMALFDAAMNMRIRRTTYRAIFEEMGEEMSEQTASRDLRQLVEAELLIPRGEKRGRLYIGGP